MIKKKLIFTWLYNPPLILVAILGIHLGWIYGLAQHNPSIINLTALSGINVYLENGMTVNQVMLMLIIASILAATGIVLEPFISRNVAVLLLLFQYVLVFIALTSDSYIIISHNALFLRNGEYVKEYISREVSIPLLLGLVWIALLHTYGMLLRYFVAWDYNHEILNTVK